MKKSSKDAIPYSVVVENGIQRLCLYGEPLPLQVATNVIQNARKGHVSFDDGLSIANVTVTVDAILIDTKS